MPLVPPAPLLAALLTPGLLLQDAAGPSPAPPAPADAPAAAAAPAAADDHGTLKLPPTGGPRPTADQADVDEAARRMTDLTNQFRKKNDLPPVTRNETLAAAAEKFGRFLAAEALFGHQAGGTTPSQRVEAAGYDYCAVRENLAYHFDAFGFSAAALADASVDGWIDSPGHRANLLADDVTETGVGVVYDPESGRYFSVQLFGLPASAAVAFEVENRTAQPQTYRVGAREYTLPPRYVQQHKACAAGPVEVRLGPAPPAGEEKGDEGGGEEEKTPAAKPLTLTTGQVLILRPADDGGVDPEVWSPPAEETVEDEATEETASAGAGRGGA